jgi:hypothetical protein
MNAPMDNPHDCLIAAATGAMPIADRAGILAGRSQRQTIDFGKAAPRGDAAAGSVGHRAGQEDVHDQHGRHRVSIIKGNVKCLASVLKPARA